MSSESLASGFLRFIHPSLEIPSKLQKVLFPHQALSVAQFLQFPLPIILITPAEHLVSTFLSNEEPTTDDPSLISKVPVPEAAAVSALGEALKSAGVSRIGSITCPHAPLVSGRFPVWIITYWTEIISLRATREPWVRAEEALRKRKRKWKKQSSFVDDTYLALSNLPWFGNIQGFDNQEPISDLARYITHEWLTDVHENQMLDLLRRHLFLDPTTRGIEVENLAFMVFIERGYRARESGEYAESNYFAHARGLGEALSSGRQESVLLIKNIGNKHWVSFDLNFKDSCIRYGDSFGEEPPVELMLAVEWWTYHHTGRQFASQKLEITTQEDGFSCGLLAFNALAHRADPKKYPLIAATEVDDARLEILLAVIERHSDQIVSHIIHHENTMQPHLDDYRASTLSAKVSSSHFQAKR